MCCQVGARYDSHEGLRASMFSSPVVGSYPYPHGIMRTSKRSMLELVALVWMLLRTWGELVGNRTTRARSHTLYSVRYATAKTGYLQCQIRYIAPRS